MLTAVPAYGRDYDSQDDVKRGFHIDNHDFRISDMSSKWDNSYANKRDLKDTTHNRVKVRYNDRKDAVYVKIDRDNYEDIVETGPDKPKDAQGNSYDVGESLSTKETLERSGYNDLNDVMQDAMSGRSAGVPAMCSEGCRVEMDGMCPHNNPSILRGNALI